MTLMLLWQHYNEETMKQFGLINAGLFKFNNIENILTHNYKKKYGNVIDYLHNYTHL